MSTDTSATVNFLTLPKDIRLIIYEYVGITTRHVKTDCTGDTSDYITLICRFLPLELVATCKLMRSEVGALLGSQLERETPRIIVSCAPNVFHGGQTYPGAWGGHHKILARALYGLYMSVNVPYGQNAERLFEGLCAPRRKRYRLQYEWEDSHQPEDKQVMLPNFSFEVKEVKQKALVRHFINTFGRHLRYLQR